MEYVPPVNGDAGDPDRPYIDGDPSLAQAGSIPSARFFNLLLAEGKNLVEGAGLNLDPGDDGQWLQAVSGLIGAAVDAPRWLVMEETSTLTIPPGIATELTNLSLSDGSLVDTVAISSGFTVGPEDAGVWAITVRGNVVSGIRESLSIRIGGATVIGQILDGSSMIPTMALVYPILAGETLQFYLTHHHTDPLDTTDSGLITAARISGL